MIFFDIDGTLLDLAYAQRKGLEGMLRLYPQVRIDPSRAWTFWCTVAEAGAEVPAPGRTSFIAQRRARIQQLFLQAGRRLSDYEVEEALAAYVRFSRDVFMPYEDVVPCLDALKGHRFGVVTNGERAEQTAKLEAMGLAGRIEVVVAFSDVGFAKPHPEIFLEGCRRARTDPRECVYVGDRYETDCRGSRLAGMRPVWLRRAGVLSSDVPVIRSLAQLPQLAGKPAKPKPARAAAPVRTAARTMTRAYA